LETRIYCNEERYQFNDADLLPGDVK
jgi:hypothetical protein